MHKNPHSRRPRVISRNVNEREARDAYRWYRFPEASILRIPLAEFAPLVAREERGNLGQ